MKKTNSPDPETVVCAMYHFVTLPDLEAKSVPLQGLLDRHNLKGTVLLAREGINGTVAGGREGIEALLDWLRADQEFADIKWKLSYDVEPPFHRAKVKLKHEIVTMGVEHIDPRRIVGTYVSPADWNALIEDPDVTVIDTRNEYEIQIGSFRNALNPHTSTFRQFPDYVKKHLDPKKNKKVAMFCTGGIRCEKSTAFLKEQGFEEVYHLEGGILKYLEEVPEAESLWRGECFVFDNRVSVNHQLEPGQYRQCHGCRMPLSSEDMQKAAYVEGVSCHHCHQTQSAQRKARFTERQKQVQLANQRGESHIGADATKAHRERRERKLRRKQEDRNAEIERAVAIERPPE